MVTGTVALPWAQLRHRKVDPTCTSDAVAAEDLQGFLCMMALAPLGTYDDAVTLRCKLLALRQFRIDVYTYVG